MTQLTPSEAMVAANAVEVQAEHARFAERAAIKDEDLKGAAQFAAFAASHETLVKKLREIERASVVILTTCTYCLGTGRGSAQGFYRPPCDHCSGMGTVVRP